MTVTENKLVRGRAPCLFPRPLADEKPRILLVDDDSSFTDMLRTSLRIYGNYQVSVENSSLKALAAARRIYPDVIILDALMPGIDGFEVLRRLENDPGTRDIPVVFLTAISRRTGFSLNEVSEAAQRVTLGKPVRIFVLIGHIEEAIQSNGSVVERPANIIDINTGI